MSDNVILDMLLGAEKNSTKIDTNEVSDNIVFERDKHGNLCSYNKDTGEKIGQIYEHGNNTVAKTFHDLL